eukprot:COSAG02_NODE_513_length_20826_cov_323.015246_15_plen_142_part_00
MPLPRQGREIQTVKCLLLARRTPAFKALQTTLPCLKEAKSARQDHTEAVGFSTRLCTQRACRSWYLATTIRWARMRSGCSIGHQTKRAYYCPTTSNVMPNSEVGLQNATPLPWSSPRISQLVLVPSSICGKPSETSAIRVS